MYLPQSTYTYFCLFVCFHFFFITNISIRIYLRNTYMYLYRFAIGFISIRRFVMRESKSSIGIRCLLVYMWWVVVLNLFKHNHTFNTYTYRFACIRTQSTCITYDIFFLFFFFFDIIEFAYFALSRTQKQKKNVRTTNSKWLRSFGI